MGRAIYCRMPWTTSLQDTIYNYNFGWKLPHWKLPAGNYHIEILCINNNAIAGDLNRKKLSKEKDESMVPSVG